MSKPLINQIKKIGFDVCAYEDGTFCIHQNGDVIEHCDNKKHLQSTLVRIIQNYLDFYDK